MSAKNARCAETSRSSAHLVEADRIFSEFLQYCID
jgi:hypothetical protein